MKKWLVVLAIALLLNCLQAQCEADEVYYTNQADRYYHCDPDCDRPTVENWWGGATTQFYDRESYRKYEISETAALEFDKAACPICVKKFTPVYLGDHMPEWSYDAQPWEISGLDPEQQQAFWNARPQAFIDEIVATETAFEAYYAEEYNRETDRFERKHAYPAAYAGKYANNARCLSYAVVDPDDEILAVFEDMFGGGAWIVPAKYGYDEIYAERERIFQEMIAWCDTHPELDVRVVSANGPDYENYAVIGINGADWQQAAEAFEDTAPIYIHFAYAEAFYTTDF